jgi:hypothetical protein
MKNSKTVSSKKARLFDRVARLLLIGVRDKESTLSILAKGDAKQMIRIIWFVMSSCFGPFLLTRQREMVMVTHRKAVRMNKTYVREKTTAFLVGLMLSSTVPCLQRVDEFALAKAIRFSQFRVFCFCFMLPVRDQHQLSFCLGGVSYKLIM